MTAIRHLWKVFRRDELWYWILNGNTQINHREFEKKNGVCLWDLYDCALPALALLYEHFCPKFRPRTRCNHPDIKICLRFVKNEENHWQNLISIKSILNRVMHFRKRSYRPCTKRPDPYMENNKYRIFGFARWSCLKTVDKKLHSWLRKKTRLPSNSPACIYPMLQPASPHDPVGDFLKW